VNFTSPRTAEQEKSYARKTRLAKDLPNIQMESHLGPGDEQPRSILKKKRRMSDPAVLEARAHHKIWPVRKTVHFVKHITDQ